MSRNQILFDNNEERIFVKPFLFLILVSEACLAKTGLRPQKSGGN